MAFIALIVAAEAMLYSASWSKRGHARRQQVLMGNSPDSVSNPYPGGNRNFCKYLI